MAVSLGNDSRIFLCSGVIISPVLVSIVL
jgi:hypothetical protein